jgi:membrane protein
MAAAMAYYVAMSFFPLLIVLTAGVSAALEWTVGGQDARRQLLTVIEQQSSPALAEQIERALSVVSRGAAAGSLVGFLILLVTSIAIFTQLQAAFDKIWNVPSTPRVTWEIWVRQQLLGQLKALAMLLGVGTFVVTVIIASLSWSLIQAAFATAGYSISSLQEFFGVLINIGFNFLAFTLIYRFVPKPNVRWLMAAQGGALAALFWEVGRQILAMYMTRSGYLSVYGIIGSFIAIMLWAYYAMIVVFFGAEFTFVSGQETSDLYKAAA